MSSIRNMWVIAERRAARLVEIERQVVNTAARIVREHGNGLARLLAVPPFAAIDLHVAQQHVARAAVENRHVVGGLAVARRRLVAVHGEIHEEDLADRVRGAHQRGGRGRLPAFIGIDDRVGVRRAEHRRAGGDLDRLAHVEPAARDVDRSLLRHRVQERAVDRGRVVVVVLVRGGAVAPDVERRRVEPGRHARRVPGVNPDQVGRRRATVEMLPLNSGERSWPLTTIRTLSVTAYSTTFVHALAFPASPPIPALATMVGALAYMLRRYNALPDPLIAGTAKVEATVRHDEVALRMRAGVPVEIRTPALPAALDLESGDDDAAARLDELDAEVLLIEELHALDGRRRPVNALPNADIAADDLDIGRGAARAGQAGDADVEIALDDDVFDRGELGAFGATSRRPSDCCPCLL